MAKEIINYPIKEAQTEPVINIAGRDFMLMPYEMHVSEASERIEWSDKHGQDGLGYCLNQAIDSFMLDIRAALLDGVALTVTEEESDDPRVRNFKITLPIVLPVESQSLLNDYSEENVQRRTMMSYERRNTGKPRSFKLVEKIETN